MPALQTHEPVLLEETLEALRVKPDGVYIDCTFGRGGHSQSLLDCLSPQGRLYLIDQDPSAIQFAKKHFGSDNRVRFVHESFANLLEIGESHGLREYVDGILFDLGVSSPQLDQAARGFSFNNDGPLDMRMNTMTGESAAQWLTHVTLDELIKVLREYGEERHAKKIATKILTEQKKSTITTTKHLAEIVYSCYPANYQGIHPATRTFQAIRIYINQELDALHHGLRAAFELLASNGRLAVISFHSLEDRIVKRFIRETRDQDIPKNLPVIVEAERHLRAVGKLIRPQERELASNPRARSARLRVAEKVTP